MWQHEVTKLLEERIGLSEASVGPALIESAVHKRSAALGLRDPSAYLEILRSSAGELMELIEETVISESWFFRDGRPFEHLQGVARAFWSKSWGAPFRVLSVPCAGGEEAYSIAIALLEAMPAGASFEIDAVDISSRRLAQARRGIYSRNAFRTPLSDERARFFQTCAAGQEVVAAVREHVRFMQGNLLDAGFLSEQPAYDAIWCRNLLIYLTESARQQVVDTLDRLLGPQGTLYVGHAETLALLQPRFTVDADRASFALQRAAAAPPVMPAAVTAPPVPQILRQERRGQRAGVREAEDKISRPHAPPRPSTNPVAHGAPPSTGVRGAGAYLPPAAPVADAPGSPAPKRDDLHTLDDAARLADRNQHAEAIKLLNSLIRDQGPSARAYALLGMIDLATGQAERAEAHLLKAVYLDGTDEESLLALALICQGRGDQAGAERYRARAQRAHQAKEVAS